MSTEATTTDHKAEALREARQYAAAADREAARLNTAEAGPTKAAATFAAVSRAYSNLAIAEGQERVAEEIKVFRELFASNDGRWAEVTVDGHVTTGAP